MDRRSLLCNAGLLGVGALIPTTVATPTDLRRDALMKVLSFLDNIATSDGGMSWDDIDDLCQARELLASILGVTYDEETSRFVQET